MIDLELKRGEYFDKLTRLIYGNCLKVMPELPANSIKKTKRNLGTYEHPPFVESN